MRERALAAHVIARLVEDPDRCFANQPAWTTHLERLGISALTVNPDPMLRARQETTASRDWFDEAIV